MLCKINNIQQGTVLSPSLFNNYIEELIHLLNKGEMAEKHGKQLTVLYIENPIKLHRTLY